MFGGGLLGLEQGGSGRQRGQGGGSVSGLQLDLPGWATDSGVFSSLANSIASSRDAGDVDSTAAAAAADVAKQAQRKQQHRQREGGAPDCGQLAVSPTADKENQGQNPRGGGQRKGQQPPGIDWQDFLSGKQYT